MKFLFGEIIRNRVAPYKGEINKEKREKKKKKRKRERKKCAD